MLRGRDKEMLENEMRACFLQLKRTSYGKQVVAIEKLLYSDAPPAPITNDLRHMTTPAGNNGADNLDGHTNRRVANHLVPASHVNPVLPQGPYRGQRVQH